MTEYFNKSNKIHCNKKSMNCQPKNKTKQTIKRGKTILFEKMDNLVDDGDGKLYMMPNLIKSISFLSNVKKFRKNGRKNIEKLIIFGLIRGE